MTCKHLSNCVFIEKINRLMPQTTKMVIQTYCADNKSCVMNRLAKTMIEHIAEVGLQERTD
jgi:hypothetical protein